MKTRHTATLWEMPNKRISYDNLRRNRMTDRILHVDDDPIFLDLVQAIFRNNKQVIVTSRDNAENALASIQSLKPDLIISDIAMPNMGGLTFIHELRAVPQTAQTPIILLSGRAQNLEAYSTFREMDLIIMEKPVDPDRLRSKVEALLARAKRGLPTAE
jgi:two-component system OmpR family response regulator